MPEGNKNPAGIIDEADFEQVESIRGLCGKRCLRFLSRQMPPDLRGVVGRHFLPVGDALGEFAANEDNALPGLKA